MTAPRPVLPGKTYLVTRRCLLRHMFLHPTEHTNQIFQFALAHAARKHGVRVHAYCVMSDHFHLVVTDPDSHLPAFCQQLNSVVARAGNTSLGQHELFWAPGSYSAVALQDQETIVGKAAYTLANPVQAGLVRWGREWPGLWSDPNTIGQGTVTVKRPTVFFRADGAVPRAAALELTPPPGFSAEAFRQQLLAATAALEEEAQAERRRRGKGFLGRERVLRTKATARALGREGPRTLNPRIAAKDDETRAAAVKKLREFRDRYRAAWKRWCAGLRDTVFPAGTYLLRVLFKISCELPS